MPADSGGASQDTTLSELLDLSIPADFEAMAKVVDTISEVLERREVPEQKRLEIGLALQEALANAIVHGCGNDPSKEVQCRVQSDPQGHLVITVTDPGPGFRPEVVADPNRPENLYADHGRGVYLIRQLMDEVSFERRGNEIRMWKY
jgi:serine/threonine-protein kinase RsbW